MIKASPLTVLKIEFIRTSVEANDRADPGTVSEFDFAGSSIGWAFHSGKNQDGTTWVGVGFATEPDPEEGPICPYIIDIQAVGLFGLQEGSQVENPEKFIFECGAALVYGAIREMVSNITSRSAFGPLMLPTPTFQGLYEQKQAENQN